MYGRDEHRDALKRIGVAARDVETLRDSLAGLRADLDDDGVDPQHLREASKLLGSVLAALDNQATDLPTPLAR